MKYIKLYENRHDFVFDEQRFFPATSLVQGEEEPTYFTDVEEVVFELTVTLPTEKVVTGQTYTLAVEYGGADVFSEATVTATGDVTLNGTQFTANTDGDFSVTATYDGKTVTLNGTSKLMTAAPRTGINDTGCGIYRINIYGNAPKRITFNGEEFTPSQQEIFNYKNFYADLTEQTVFVTATAQEEGKWESDVATATYTIPVLETLTASISDDTLEDGQTAQITVKYGNQNVTEHIGIKYTASGDVTCSNGDGILHKGAGVVTATYSTGSGSIVVSHNGGLGNPNLTPITINVTVTEAVSPNIVFADPDVKSIIVNKYGSNGEITEEQAAAVTTFMSGTNKYKNPFYKNANVDSFDEFTYFTGVTEIGNNAFQECSNMTSIILPENVTTIGESALESCSGMQSITLPSSLTYIGYSALKYCSSLESVTIPESVTKIAEQAFYACEGLMRITCDATTPPTLNSPSGTIFTQFNLTNNCPIYVPEESVNLYKQATGWNKYASRIKSRNMTFDDPAVDSIVTTAFGSNGKVTYDEAAAVKTWFSGTDSSTNPFYNNVYVYAFPEFTYFTSVSEIGNNAFGLCKNMTSITLPSRVTSIGDSAFTGCEKLENVNIPETVTSIGNFAFYNCNSIQSINIPETVTSIGDSAFNRCTTLPSITIPASVTRIGNEAFRRCSQLIVSGVTCNATTPPTLGSDVFSETSNCPIYVPLGSVDTYKAATGWSNYADRIQSIQYAVAYIDCSRLEDTNPLTDCTNSYYDAEQDDWIQEGNGITCMFGGDTESYVENGVITIPAGGIFEAIEVNVPDPPYDGCIGYVKLTHPSAEYKLGQNASVGDDGLAFTCDVDFDSTTLTTTFSNFVSADQESVFNGMDFMLKNNSYGHGDSDIKITRIEVAFIPAEEEPAE